MRKSINLDFHSSYAYLPLPKLHNIAGTMQLRICSYEAWQLAQIGYYHTVHIGCGRDLLYTKASQPLNRQLPGSWWWGKKNYWPRSGKPT